MSEIKPALTAEEWASPLVWGTTEVGPKDERHLLWCHRMAALCLHNQPFGFTREDVAAMRETAEDLEKAGWDASHARSLADRIEALLPPEPTP